ncbi:MAG: hypothetical protein JWO03_3736 [Bacteroidetes bacterium]|nr:hypothetical protein [Bacteroidota bacterium]
MKKYELKPISHYPVNWIDGMKISKQHFIQTEYALQDHFRDSVAITVNNHNYGLLSPAPDMASSLEVDIQIDPQNIIHVSLKTCRAIAPNGARIEILKGSKVYNYSGKRLSAEHKHDGGKATQTYAIIAQVNPYQRVPSGEPDASEQPARHPFSVPEVSVSILPVEQLQPTEGNYLILAKLTNDKGEWMKDDQFIPACVAVQNYRKLHEAYAALGGQFEELVSSCTQIIQKVKGEKQKTNLSLNIQYVAEQLMSFMVDKVMRYRWLYSQESPVHTVEVFVSLTYCLKTGFDCLTERDREEMFTYFEQWSLLKPVEFEMLIQDILSIAYDHNDTSASLTGVRRFMDVMVLLFGKLSKLKFIGEQHDTGIVLGETIEPKKQEKKPGGWSFLAD